MNKMMVDLRNVLIPKTTVITHFCSARPHRRLLVKKEKRNEPPETRVKRRNDYVYNKDPDNGNSGRVGVRHHGWVPILFRAKSRPFVRCFSPSLSISIHFY